MEDGFHFRHGLQPSRERPEIPSALQTVADVLDRGFSDDPEAPALVGGHAQYSYRGLVEASLRAAAVLTDAGVRSGDRVAACLPNGPEIVVAFLGAMRVGAVWVGVPGDLSLTDKMRVLDGTDASLLLADAATHDALQPRRRELRDLRQILVADAGRSEWNLALAREDDPAPPEDVDPWAAAAIGWVRDGAGRLRGVVHSQHNLVLPGAVAAERAAWPAGLRQGACLPWTTLEGLVLGPLLAFQTRGCCVTVDRADPAGLAGWVRRESIAVLHTAPATLDGLLAHPGVSAEDLEPLEHVEVLGARLPDGLRARHRERFGRELVYGHGVPEAPGPVTRSDAAAPEPEDGAGRALPHVEVRIVGEDGRERPDGEEGEVALRPASRGPFAGVWTPTLGYWNQPDATRTALRDGLLRTGDVGRVDAEGRLHLSGRTAPG